MAALETPDARAQCPHCYKRVAVRKNGTLRHHTNGRPEWPGSPFSKVCPGTGRDVHLMPEASTQGGCVMAEQQFVFDDLARVIRAPYWACPCGTLLHPTAGATESERRTQPRCEQCSAHGRSPQMRQVVVSIEHEGWGA